MRVADTPVWIEYLPETPCGDRVDAEFPRRDALPVPTIVQIELAQWLRRTQGGGAAKAAMAFHDTRVAANLDTGIALSAAGLGATRKLATAQACHVGVRFIPKRGA